MTTPTEDRPLVTFALFAYNQEEYIREAVEGAFSQTYEPLEIILSDDCSNDRTFEIMQEMAAAYEGPHEVRVRRSRKNNGLMAHINAVHRVSRGEFIVMAAGDDISLPDRIAHLAEGFENDCVMAVCSAYYIHGSDAIVHPKALENSTVLPAMHHAMNLGGVGHGATYAYRRCVFPFSGYAEKGVLSEDRILPIRAALMGVVLYINSPTIIYRVFSDPLTIKTKIPSRRQHKNRAHIEEVVKSIKYAYSKGLVSFFTKESLVLAVKVSAQQRKSTDRFSGILKIMDQIFWRFLLVPFRAIRRFST
ncbi:MAG: glycosyltransferase family 2 protein [Rhodovulum sp.]